MLIFGKGSSVAVDVAVERVSASVEKSARLQKVVNVVTVFVKTAFSAPVLCLKYPVTVSLSRL